MRSQRSCRVFTMRGTRSRCHGSITVVAHSGSRPTMERTLSRAGTAIGKTQDVVVEAIFLIPHTFRSHLIHSARDPEEMLHKLDRHVFVKRCRGAANSTAISNMFWQNSDTHAVPSACSRCPPVGSGALRSKTPMLSSPRNPPSKRFLPKRSLRLTHQLKFSVSLANVRLRNSMSPFPC